jgi:uncharacterized membrane protein
MALPGGVRWRSAHMGEYANHPHDASAERFPLIRTVAADAPMRWLAAGFRDMRLAGSASLFYGLCFAAAGWLMHIVIAQAYALFAGLTSGFLLIGPLLAMGLYDLSRSIERGGAPRLTPTLAAWRPNLANVAIFAAVLAIVLLVWARASMVVFALFYEGGLPTFADVVHAVVQFGQPTFALIYFAVGGFFAAFVFAISVIAVPLMLDRRADAITAAIASIVACGRSPGPMLLWATCIAALTAIGFATLFLGLIVTMPLVGHATWHAYRDIVGPAANADIS